MGKEGFEGDAHVRTNGLSEGGDGGGGDGLVVLSDPLYFRLWITVRFARKGHIVVLANRYICVAP